MVIISVMVLNWYVDLFCFRRVYRIPDWNGDNWSSTEDRSGGGQLEQFLSICTGNDVARQECHNHQTGDCPPYCNKSAEGEHLDTSRSTAQMLTQIESREVLG